MSLQEEFSRLIYMYTEAAEGRGTSVKELFEKTRAFIEKLRNQLTEADPEDRQAAIRMIGELYQHMRAHIERSVAKSGMSEEEWVASLESTANFTPDQWREMQESKQKIRDSGKELAKLLRPEEFPSQAPPSHETMSDKKKGPKKKHLKRSDWTRS